MSHHKVNPRHGEEGHECPWGKTLQVTIPVQDVMDIVCAVELAITESARDAISNFLDGDTKGAEQAAVAHLTWIRAHSGLVNLLTQFMEKFQEEHGVEEEANLKERPPIPDVILKAFADTGL